MSSKKLYNKDLAPTPSNKKNWGWFEIFNVWANDVQSLFGYTLAASLFIASGLNGWAVFLALILAGVFNSGILAKGIGDNVTYNYDKIPNHIQEKYVIVSEVCDRYNVPVPAAALQFSYANKLISSMILGMDRLEQIKQNISFLNHLIPEDL